MQQPDLEEEIVNLRVQNRFAAIRLQNLHEEMDEFLKVYYEAVGDLCMQFSDYQDRQKEYRRKLKDEDDVNDDAQAARYQITLREDSEKAQKSKEEAEKEAKSLYRKLIKVTHPDISEEKLKAAEYSRMVNEAYNQKNYEQLIRLDEIITKGGASKHDLVKQRNKLIDTTFDLKIQRDQMLDNPIYKLMLSFREQDDNGTKMYAKIRKNLETKIATEKRKLMSLKLEYLEKVQDKIIA